VLRTFLAAYQVLIAEPGVCTTLRFFSPEIRVKKRSNAECALEFPRLRP
jgi:hypothetical protein